MTGTILKTAAIAMTAPALALAAPVSAAAPAHAQFAGVETAAWSEVNVEHHRGRDYRDDRYRYGRGHDRGYDRGYYDEPVYRDTRVWRGRDGRYYCRKRDGTTGLLIGAAGGALLGREIAGRNGDRTLGAILGAAGGALLGRAIDRGSSRCR